MGGVGSLRSPAVPRRFVHLNDLQLELHVDGGSLAPFVRVVVVSNYPSARREFSAARNGVGWTLS